MYDLPKATLKDEAIEFGLESTGTKVQLRPRYLTALRNMSLEGISQAKATVKPVLVVRAMDTSANNLAGTNLDLSALLHASSTSCKSIYVYGGCTASTSFNSVE
jgi:hypothetical protein